MTGIRAYTLVDVLKQINDQGAPTVSMIVNEVGAILFGNASVNETIVGSDAALFTRFGNHFVWGPSAVPDVMALIEQARVTQTTTTSTTKTDTEQVGVVDRAAVSPTPPAGGQTGPATFAVAVWGLFQWA